MNQQTGAGATDSPPHVPWQSIVDRAKMILLRPKEFWPVAKSESVSGKDFYLRYFLILAAIPAICGLIGITFIGISIPIIGTIRAPFLPALVGQLVEYGVTAALLPISALALVKLAPKFGGSITRDDALKLVGYSMTPGLVGGILLLIPSISPIGLSVLGLYSIYIFYLGLPLFAAVPSERKLGFFIVSVVAIVCISIFMSYVTSALRPVPSLQFQSVVPGQL